MILEGKPSALWQENRVKPALGSFLQRLRVYIGDPDIPMFAQDGGDVRAVHPPKSRTLSSGDTGRRRRNSSPRFARAFRDAFKTACFSKLRTLTLCLFDSSEQVPTHREAHFPAVRVASIVGCKQCALDASHVV